MDQNSRRRLGLTSITRRMEIGLPDTQTMRRRVDDVGRVVQSASAKLLSERKIQLEGLGFRLRALDPLATLGRGFSIVQLPDSGKVVSSTNQVSLGDSIEITVTDGSIPAIAGPATTVESKKTVTSEPKTPKPRAKAKAQPPGMHPLL